MAISQADADKAFRNQVNKSKATNPALVNDSPNTNQSSYGGTGSNSPFAPRNNNNNNQPQTPFTPVASYQDPQTGQEGIVAQYENKFTGGRGNVNFVRNTNYTPENPDSISYSAKEDVNLAQFRQKFAVASSSAGTIFADTSNNRVAKNRSGQFVTTFEAFGEPKEQTGGFSGYGTPKQQKTVARALLSGVQRNVNEGPIGRGTANVFGAPAKFIRLIQPRDALGRAAVRQSSFALARTAGEEQRSAKQGELSFLKSLAADIPVVSGFGYRPFTGAADRSANAAFTRRYRETGGNAFLLDSSLKEFKRQRVATKATNEALLLGLSAGIELGGRAALSTGKATFMTVNRLSKRAGFTTARLGLIEGSLGNVIDQSGSRKSVNFGKVLFSGASGALSAGTITGTQLRLDLGNRPSRIGGRAFNALVNTVDPGEPIGDILATGFQREVRSRNPRRVSVMVLEPSVVMNKQGKGAFVGSIVQPNSPLSTKIQRSTVNFQSNVFVSAKTSPETRTEINRLLGTTTRTPTSSRTSARTSSRTNPFTETRTNPFTETAIRPQTNPFVTTRTRTSVRVTAADFPPILPPFFRTGGSGSGGRGLPGNRQRLGLTSSLAGQILSVRRPRGANFATVSGLGIR